jgi:protein-S-isoprenylcysteine O-methyltransferase Ste14
LGWILVASGLTLATTALILFFRRRTTVRPDRPATALVTSGPYKFTRNPMYVSQVLMYAGLAIMWQSVWALLLLPFVVVYIDRQVIRREESHLERRFGTEYREYRARTRRWL